MEDKKTFYQNNSIDTILNEYDYIDFVFNGDKIIKNITKDLYEFLSEEEILKKINDFVNHKRSKFLQKSKKFDFIKTIFLELSEQKKEEFIRSNLKNFETRELSQLLKNLIPNKSLIEYIYYYMNINNGITEFIQLINLLMIQDNYSTLFSDEELFLLIKKVKKENLPQILNCNNIIMLSDEILSWYKENCVIEKLSELEKKDVYGITLYDLEDDSINLMFQITKEIDISNLKENGSIPRLLSIPGEVQDTTIDFLVNDFNAEKFFEMMRLNFDFSNNLSENNCKKILSKLDKSFDLSKIHIMTLLLLLNKITDLNFLTDFIKRCDIKLILEGCKRYEISNRYDEIVKLTTNILDTFEGNPQELIDSCGASFLHSNYFGKNINLQKAVLKNIFSDEEFIESLKDEDIRSLYKKDTRWLENNSEKFIRFYKSLQNNPNISQVADFFSEFPLISCCYTKNEIAEENIIDLEKALNTYTIFIYKHLDKSRFPSETQNVLNDLKIYLNGTGKINTLEENPVVNYDFIKYIYRNLGLNFSVKLSRFNTSATKELIEAIKTNEIDLIKFYIGLYEKYNLFEENDRKENVAFLNFSSFKELLKDIKNKNLQLNETDIKNLKNIILSGNKYDIKTVDNLINYKITVEKYINELLESEDLGYIKENIAKNFCNSFKDLKSKFYGYELCNFSKIIEVSRFMSQEEKNKLQLSTKEIKLVFLLKNIINCQNIEKLKMLLKGLISDGEIIDYRDDFNNIINKIRNMYGISFNSVLTNINTLKSPRDTKSVPGVTIIDLNGENFNFYAHRLYNYDAKFSSYSKMLEDDPSLWTKLEGASTLSTSCISNKGLHFLHNKDPHGVVYLFNNIPNHSMLFMYGRDLYVSHGGHQFEPTSTGNKFTDFESLVQSTNYHSGTYNELALFREGIMPCAFACIGDTPNEATIRAAKYFSEVLKKDIPIIKLNYEIYKKQNEEIRKNARKNFSSKATPQNLKEIFYDGTGNIEEKVDFSLNELKLQHKKGIIDYKDYIQLLVAMENFIDRIYDKDDNKLLKRKVQLLRQSICMINNLTEDEIIEIETANLGESGIMYKMQDGNNEYLLKPSVEKGTLKNEPFRAEIQKAASTLQSIISPNTSVSVDVLSEGPLRIAQQELIRVDESKKASLNNWFNHGGHLPFNYTNQLLQEYVVDFLLCNFDCYSGNFIIDSNNNIRGIDKEQSFRFIQDSNTLDPSFSYWPNGSQRIPIYFKIFEEYKNGRLDLNLDVIKECIKKVEVISDEEYIKIFEKYVESLDPENKQVILQMILDRKKVCTQILKDYVVELQNSRNGGVKL